jgi:hypothetical protein
MKCNRTTVPVTTNIRPELLDRAKADGDRAGYRTLRAYLEALITQGLTSDRPTEEPDEPDEQTKALVSAYPSAAWALGPSILVHRTVLALEALTDRIRAGENVGALERDLTVLRKDIGAELWHLRGAYDREVAARDARHYGRQGGVE